MGERRGARGLDSVFGIFQNWKKGRGSIRRQGQTVSEVLCQENTSGPCKIMEGGYLEVLAGARRWGCRPGTGI